MPWFKVRPSSPVRTTGIPNVSFDTIFDDEPSPLTANEPYGSEPCKLIGTASFAISALASGSAATQAVTVTGAVAGDIVNLTTSAPLPNSVYLVGAVTAADTVTAKAVNQSGSPLTQTVIVTAEVFPAAAFRTFLAERGRG